MTDQQRDTDLRARFAAQRLRDRDKAPAFAEMMASARAAAAHAPPQRASRTITLRRLVYGSSLAAAAVIATLLVLPRVRSNENEFEQAVRAYESGPGLGAWQSPTDGLLNVPGSQLISTVPTVGVN